MCTFEHFNISYCVVHGSKFAQRDCIVSLSLATRDRRVRVELCRAPAREAPPFVSRLESRGRYVRPGVSVPAPYYVLVVRISRSPVRTVCGLATLVYHVGCLHALGLAQGAQSAPPAPYSHPSRCTALSRTPSHSRRPPAHHAPERALGASQTDALAFRSPSATALSPSTHVNFVCFESAMSARICHQGPFDAIEGQLGGSSGAMRSNQVPH